MQASSEPTLLLIVDIYLKDRKNKNGISKKECQNVTLEIVRGKVLHSWYYVSGGACDYQGMSMGLTALLRKKVKPRMSSGIMS